MHAPLPFLLVRLLISLSCLLVSVEGINILKYLFGLPCEPGGAADISDEKLNEVVNLLKTLEGNIAENENSTAIVGKSALDHVKCYHVYFHFFGISYSLEC